MKVYILKQEFEYEGFYIKGVFSDKCKALAISEIMNKRLSKREYNTELWTVEEYVVDESYN